MRLSRRNARPHLGYNLPLQAECQHIGLEGLSANQVSLPSHEACGLHGWPSNRLTGSIMASGTKAGANFIISSVNFSSSSMHYTNMHPHADYTLVTLWDTHSFGRFFVQIFWYFMVLQFSKGRIACYKQWAGTWATTQVDKRHFIFGQK